MFKLNFPLSCVSWVVEKLLWKTKEKREREREKWEREMSPLKITGDNFQFLLSLSNNVEIIFLH